MLDEIIFCSKINKRGKRRENGSKLISQNILSSKLEIMECSLEKYEDFSAGYNTLPKARFNKIIAEELKRVEKDSSITEIKIVKYGGFMFPSLLTPTCSLCESNLRRVGEEITRKKKDHIRKEYRDLFYFCTYCGFVGKKMSGL